jgi:hypothetical protein
MRSRRRIRPWRITLIFFLTFLSLIVINQISLVIAPCHSTYEESKRDEKSEQPGYYCSPKDGIVAQGISRFSEIPPEWWTTVFSGLLALFTWTLWKATDALWRVSIIHARHLARSVGATERAANAAKENADAAKITADAVIAQMRAYVKVYSAKVHGFDGDGPIRIQVRIGNNGGTVAFDVAGLWGVTVRPAEVYSFKGELWPETRDPLAPPPMSRAGLAPRAVFDSFNEIRPLSPEEKTAIRDGSYGIFAYGELLYKDALKNPRRTTYRLMYGGAAGADPNGLFVVCEEGNYSD